MRTFSFRVVATLALLAISVCGCSKPHPDGLPKLVPCSVTIVQESKPLEGATVSFESNDLQWSVGGTTDANGVAKMYTHGQYQGVPEGTYKVTVVKQKIEWDGGTESASSAASGQAYNYVDLQYNTSETTPLEITVEGKTSESFDVGSAIKEPVKTL